MNTNMFSTTISAANMHQLKPQRGLPGTSRFKVTPKKKPQLCQFVKSANWNCVESTVTLEILETPGFSAFDWIYNINIIRKALQKSPFCDIEQDLLFVQIYDDEDIVIGQIKLKGLELKNHECKMDRGRSDNLSHIVVVSYETLEMVDFRPEVAQAQDFNAVSGEDWAKERLDLPPSDNDTFRDKSEWDVELQDIEKTRKFLKDKNSSI